MSCLSFAIIAHGYHGKTTLLDHLLRQSGALKERGPAVERVMDSDPQERERGITILAKCTSIEWRGHTLQIVDTPGQGFWRRSGADHAHGRFGVAPGGCGGGAHA